jgi:tRNA wybutosine-synthesizing protein 3
MNSFKQRKKDVLSKVDKSFIGKWDKKVLDVCKKINSLENYYTTSSCSGRIMIIKDFEEKKAGLFKFVSHELVDFEEFIEEVNKIKKGNFKFKQEAVILHVACKDLESAEKLLVKSFSAGFKRSGIISLGKNIIVEINSTERLEFPLIKNGKFLGNEYFFREILKKANFNLKKGWSKILKLEGFL